MTTTTAVPSTPRRPVVTYRDGLVLGCLLAGLVSTHWLIINISPSVPLGVYRYARTGDPLRRGDLIRIPAVPCGRSWLASWLPLLKPVAGMPGDTVCVAPEGLWVQGVFYGVVYATWRGKPLPVFWGCHVVGDGEVFVASHEPKSLDGRYFGLTRVEDARRAVPVWTWR